MTGLLFFNIMKDPAFLFYYQDFLVGTSFMSNESVGAYVRCMCHQAHKGTISEKDMMKICQSHEIHTEIKEKFIVDEMNGELYNERLREEISKRAKYSESRAKNRSIKKLEQKKSSSYDEDMSNICESCDPHMENENENNKRIEKEKKSEEKKGKGKEIFELDTSDPMTPVFIQWLDYKKERKEAYKSARGIKAALEELRNLSGNDPDKANLIIHQSFARNWAGMFELKNYGNTRPTPVQQPKTLEDYAHQDYSGRF